MSTSRQRMGGAVAIPSAWSPTFRADGRVSRLAVGDRVAAWPGYLPGGAVAPRAGGRDGDTPTPTTHPHMIDHPPIPEPASPARRGVWGGAPRSSGGER